MAYSITSIIISGFRGFRQTTTISFGQPITLIYGLNRQGKSSIVNAIEWCLFGRKTTETSYLRERAGWEVKHRKAKECFVECQFNDLSNGQAVKIRRVYRSKQKSDIFVVLPSGASSTDEGSIANTLKISLGDYCSAVHLHPEIIRTLVVAAPGERKEAVDRLLGLSDYREITDALTSLKPSSWTAKLDAELEGINRDITAALDRNQNTIELEIQTLRDRDVEPEFFEENGAILFGTKLLSDAAEFAARYKYPLPSIQAPAKVPDVPKFLNAMRPALKGMRNSNPVLTSQGKALGRKNSLLGLLSSLDLQANNLHKSLDIRAALLGSSTEEQVGARIQTLTNEIATKEKEMAEVSANGDLLTKAVAFFEARKRNELVSCPLCGQSTKNVESWMRHIADEQVRANVKPLQDKKNELLKELNSLTTLQRNLEKAANDVLIQQQLLEKTRADVAVALNRPLAVIDDAVVLLQEEISTVSKELENLQSEVTGVNQVLGKLEEDISILERLERVSRIRAQIQQAESIQQNPSFTELKNCRLECEQYANDLSLLTEAIQAMLTEEAKTKLSGARASIAQFFKEITDRPDFPELLVQAEDSGYEINLASSSETTRALSILNHGDLNCAALSIFLGLAFAANSSHELGAVILDDPTQSLDGISKRNLCKVVGEIAVARQVIIATADDQFKDAALKIAKNKTAYHVTGWTEDSGPTLEALSAAAHHAKP